MTAQSTKLCNSLVHTSHDTQFEQSAVRSRFSQHADVVVEVLLNFICVFLGVFFEKGCAILAKLLVEVLNVEDLIGNNSEHGGRVPSDVFAIEAFGFEVLINGIRPRLTPSGERATIRFFKHIWKAKTKVRLENCETLKIL